MNKVIRILSVASLLALAACHTVEGVGKDVQEVGEEVEEAAEDVTHTDGGHAGTDSGETCTDQLCCFCVHYTTPWV